MNQVAFPFASGAVISPCGTYRYRLERHWGPGPIVCFIMLNPSTADAEKDDPTIRRLIAFAKRDGYGGLVVVNLFAYRATEPSRMMIAKEPIGPDNNVAILAAARQADRVVVAWGGLGWFMNREVKIRDLLTIHGIPLLCLGTTASGQPRHPLYVKGDTPFQKWE